MDKSRSFDQGRELRLRARIDQLRGERDEAQTLAATARTLRKAVKRARTSRDTWRERALAAERMLNQIHDQRRRDRLNRKKTPKLAATVDLDQPTNTPDEGATQ